MNKSDFKKNANAIIEKGIKQRTFRDIYKNVRNKYRMFKFDKYNSNSKKDVMPDTTIIGDLQNLITRIGLAVSDVAIKIKCPPPKDHKDGTNPSIAINYLCLTVLNDEELFNNVKKSGINEANRLKHTKEEVEFDIENCISKYNTLLKRLIERFEFTAFKEIKIIPPTNQTKAAKSKKQTKSIYGIGLNPALTTFEGRELSRVISEENWENMSDSAPEAKSVLMQAARKSGMTADVGVMLANMPQKDVDILINQAKQATKGQKPIKTNSQNKPSLNNNTPSPPPPPPAPTIVYVPASSQKKKQLKGWQWLVLGAAIAVVVIGAILLAVFAKQIVWDQWQWIIGSIGSTAIFVGLTLLVWRMSKTDIYNYKIWGWILFAIFFILNTVLLIVFNARYKFISLCLYVYTLVGSAVLLIKYLTDESSYDKLELSLQIVGVALNVIALIIVPILIKTAVL